MGDVALGFKAHSGWAALVVLARGAKAPVVVERRRVELVDPGATWAKAPYHAAEGLEPDEAEQVARRGIASAHRVAERELRARVKELRAQGHEAVACGLLLGSGMPDWTTAQILAVHFRMHKAEGELFRDALVRAGEKCGLRVTGVPERELWQRGAKALRVSAADAQKRVAGLGRELGPPWGRDQKEAALVAWLALLAR